MNLTWMVVVFVWCMVMNLAATILFKFPILSCGWWLQLTIVGITATIVGNIFTERA